MSVVFYHVSLRNFEHIFYLIYMVIFEIQAKQIPWQNGRGSFLT